MSNTHATRITHLASILSPLVLGIAAFLVIVGLRALNPTNIAFLSVGDPAQHYLGWQFFRNAPWTIPLGMNPAYGLELANAIVYSDSNPLLAILFKPVSLLLPDTFQYIGIWLLLCFILQALFGWKLVGLATESSILRLLGAGFFVFAPPLIYRIERHASLSGHFFILAALYLVLHPKLPRRRMAWASLIAAASLVHAYLLVMVYALWITDLVGKMVNKQMSARSLLVECAVIGTVISFTCWQAGYFSVGADASSSGFGLYRMNLLSIIDSGGWSYFLRDIPGVAGDYEGFNYLGLGLIVLLAVSALSVAIGKRVAWRSLGQYWHLLILFVALSVFAVSNVVAIGPVEFRYPLPRGVLRLANVFRCSGRLFWPVFYALALVSIVTTVRAFSQRVATVVLSVTLFAQVADTSTGWLFIRRGFRTKPSSVWNSPLTDPFWADAARKYSKVRYIPVKSGPPLPWQAISYYAGQHGLSTDAVYLARIGGQALVRAQEQAANVLSTGQFEQDALYILDEAAFQTALRASKSDADLFASVDGLHVVAPRWSASPIPR